MQESYKTFNHGLNAKKEVNLSGINSLHNKSIIHRRTTSFMLYRKLQNKAGICPLCEQSQTHDLGFSPGTSPKTGGILDKITVKNMLQELKIS